MSRSNLVELDAVDRVVAMQGFYFDEDKVRNGDDVKWGLRDLRAKVLSDVSAGLWYSDLDEHEQTARLKRVRILGIDPESLVLKMDHFGVRHYKPKTWNKACDYLLLTIYNGKKYAIFIDLKTKIYEDPSGDNAQDLTVATDDNKLIAWQMIGADALLDGLIDVVQKRALTSRHTTKSNKRDASISPLAGYARRYVILYLDVDKTMGRVPPTATIQDPNLCSLEKPVHVRKMDCGNDKIDFGSLFSGCLEV